MKDKLSYLSKNILLFSLNGLLPKLLAFVLIPIYTGYLTTEEYGISDLINTTVSLLMPILTLNIYEGVLRFALDQNHGKKDVFSCGMGITLAGTGLVTLGAFLVSLLKLDGLDDTYLVFFVLMFATTALLSSVTVFCKGIDCVKTVVASGLIRSVVTLGSNILFLVVFRWGLTGYLAANTLGAVAGLAVAFFGARLYRYIHWRSAPETRRVMLQYSLPLILSSLAWWVNTASDRYILSWIAGVSISGIYAMAYKIPSLLSVFQNIFAQAWSISAVKEFDKNDNDGFIGGVYSVMSFVVMLACSVLMLVNIPVARILYTHDFFEAWHFVPPLLFAVVFNAMAVFMSSLFMAVKDTKNISVATMVGAVVNTVFNFALIPLWGAYGAAVATVMGYATEFGVRHYYLRKHIAMKIRWGRDLAGYGTLLVQVVLAYFGWKTVLIQCVCTLVLLVLYRKEIVSGASLVKSLLQRKQKS